jgi:predicted carbohydrate-binding protein with CBM5 and CBM33 domain
MKLTGSAFVLATLLAGAGVSVSANATTTPPAANCEQGHQKCMKELGSLERKINGEKVKVVEGQTIRARFFNDATELPALETRVTILAGEEAHWSYVLAQAINQQHPDLHAGFQHSNGEITPDESQSNSVYANESNPISHVEVSFN